MIHLSKCLGYVTLWTIVLPCIGCNTPRWEAGKHARSEKMHNTASKFRQHEAGGPERIDRTVVTIGKSRAYHEDHLVRTSKLVHSEWEYDKTRWVEERSKRRAFAGRYWHGKPDTIPATWAKMIY